MLPFKKKKEPEKPDEPEKPEGVELEEPESKTGYRCGAVGQYTGGNPDEASVAWRALQHEYKDLGNKHIHDDLTKFLKLPKKQSWEKTLDAFKQKYGDSKGVWLTRKKSDALELYEDYGDLSSYDYNDSDVISDIGPDGIYVLLRGSKSKTRPRRVRRYKGLSGFKPEGLSGLK